MPILTTPGLTRDIILVLDSAVIFYALLFTVSLITQWLRSPIRKWNDVRLAWAVFMFGMASNSFSFIMSDFYFTDPAGILLWTKTGYIAMMIALLGFFIALEQILPYVTHDLFTGLGVASIIITILLPLEYLNYIALFTSLLTFVMLVLFSIYYLRITAGEIKTAMRLIVIGFIVGFLGYIGRSDTVYSSFGPMVYTIAALFLVIGLLILGATVFSGPALDELDWDNQLLELYVIHENGLLMFHYEFSRIVNLDENLTAAGISGIQNLLQEIVHSTEGLNFLSIGRLSILFAHGEHFTVVLLAKHPYRVLLAKVKEFVEIFQVVFGSEIKDPAINTEKFVGTEEIVQNIFTTETID